MLRLWAWFIRKSTAYTVLLLMATVLHGIGRWREFTCYLVVLSFFEKKFLIATAPFRQTSRGGVVRGLSLIFVSDGYSPQSRFSSSPNLLGSLRRRFLPEICMLKSIVFAFASFRNIGMMKYSFRIISEMSWSVISSNTRNVKCCAQCTLSNHVIIANLRFGIPCFCFCDFAGAPRAAT